MSAPAQQQEGKSRIGHWNRHEGDGHDQSREAKKVAVMRSESNLTIQEDIFRSMQAKKGAPEGAGARLRRSRGSIIFASAGDEDEEADESDGPPPLSGEELEQRSHVSALLQQFVDPMKAGYEHIIPVETEQMRKERKRDEKSEKRRKQEEERQAQLKQRKKMSLFSGLSLNPDGLLLERAMKVDPEEEERLRKLALQREEERLAFEAKMEKQRKEWTEIARGQLELETADRHASIVEQIRQQHTDWEARKEDKAFHKHVFGPTQTELVEVVHEDDV